MASEDTDTVRRRGAQPEMSDRHADTTTGSPAAVKDTEEVAFRPTADVVAMVSRDVNGDPAQSKNFQVLIPEDASDADKDAAWNKAGEAQGAANYDHAKHGPQSFELSDKERAERDKKEAEELRRINRGE